VATMAALLSYLWNLPQDDDTALAQRASQISAKDMKGPAPAAEAEARRRSLLKRAQETNIQGTAIMGGAALLAAIAALSFLSHLRLFRPVSSTMKMVEIRPHNPDAGGTKS